MPVAGDGVAEIPVAEPVAGDGGNESPKEEKTMDEDIKAAMRQTFVMANKRLDFYAEQYLDQSRHVSTVSNQMFVLNSQMVGAGALNRVPSGLPQQVLEHNASAGQPFNSPKAV